MTGTGLPKELPLAGVRVVEMTHMVMGPTCGMILAQLGAEIIKVEPPAGDKTRSLGGMGTSFFPLFNRGKRSVVLDFAKAEDRETMHRLLASADVFLENFRDGQLDKQGLGAEELRRKYPHLIVAGHKGFLSGPYEHRPALDEVVQMMSGLAAMTGTSDKPQRVGSSANDIMGGMFGVISILAALYQKRGGATDGADIRIGLFENCLFLVAQHMVEYEMTGNKPRSMPEREHAWPIYDIFETAGGDRIFIGVVTEGHWQSFCREFGLKEFSEDPTLRTTTDRILARARIIPRVAEVIKRWDVAELSAKLDAAQHLLLADQPPRGSVRAIRTCCAPAASSTISMPMARRSGFRRCRSNGTAANIGEGLKVPVLGADTEAVRAELENEKSSPTGKRRSEARMTQVQDIYPDDRVILREVGLRDGLQLVKKFPSTAAKQRWIRDEYGAGVRHFEVGSFLPAKTFPQFADVRDIVATVASLPGAHGIALALNERGVNEALASGVAEIATVVSATEEHSQANANRSRDSAIANVKRLCELRDASAHRPIVNAAISMALGCSIVGRGRSQGSDPAGGKMSRGRRRYGRHRRYRRLCRAEAGRRSDQGGREDRGRKAGLRSPARHPRHGHRERVGRARRRRAHSRRLARRPRRLSVRARRHRQCRVRGSGVPVREQGILPPASTSRNWSRCARS